MLCKEHYCDLEGTVLLDKLNKGGDFEESNIFYSPILTLIKNK